MVATREREEIQFQGSEEQIEFACRRGREEVARWRRGEPYDDRFCFNIFRRAVLEGDEASWLALHRIYREQVLSWCWKAVPGMCADPEELLSVTWEKFWLHFTPAKLAAATCTAAVLRYLKLCARSAVFDAARFHAPTQSLDQWPVEPPDCEASPAEAHAGHDARARFWTIINAGLHDERERILIHLSYEFGLKSSEIQASRPDLFESAADVYKVARNILDRMRRNRDLLAWCEQERF